MSYYSWFFYSSEYKRDFAFELELNLPSESLLTFERLPHYYSPIGNFVGDSL